MRRLILPGIPFALSLALSLSTAGSHCYWQDSGFFLVAVKELGILYPPGFALYERLWSRPTFEVNGIFGGYSGAGSKTIIPSWAGAKLSLRLVPDQDPDLVFECVKKHKCTSAKSRIKSR